MPWIRFFRRRYWDEERAREIQSYIECEIAENVSRGMDPREARFVAQRKLGNSNLIREEIYDMNSVNWLETLWRDLQYGVRGLRGSPGFTIVAVLSLALGIGANTAIFELLDAVRLRLLPVRNPQQLADVFIRNPEHRKGNVTGRHSSLSNPQWEQVRDHQQVFSGMAAWGDSTFNIAPRGEVHLVQGLFVSGDFFSVLGVQPALGRTFNASDDQRGCGSPAAVISYSFWQREYGSEPSAIGRSLRIRGQSFEIVGVTRPEFFGVDVGRRFDVAVPICSEPLIEPDVKSLEKAHFWWLGAIGRLKPGVGLKQASAQMEQISTAVFHNTIPPTYTAEDIKYYEDFRLSAVPAGSGVSSLRGDYETPLILLLAIAGLVLLIACANLANLLLARASAREREIAVRLAIGASRKRVFLQLLSESLLLALMGAALGGLLAQVLGRYILSFLSGPQSSIFLDPTTDWRVLAFIAMLGIATCILFGVAPALRSTATDPIHALKSGSRGAGDRRERSGLRRALVVTQVALSLVLLMGALLFVQTLSNLAHLDAGFQPAGVVFAELDMVELGYSAERQRSANHEILERVRAIPGVQSAGFVAIPPLNGSGWNQRLAMEGAGSPMKVIFFNRVSDGFFHTLNVPLIAGRDFNANDKPQSPPAAIVNETFARLMTGGSNPVGKRFRREGNRREPDVVFEIVGLVKDTKYRNLREAFRPTVFIAGSQNQEAEADPTLFIRSALPLASLTGPVSKAIESVSKGASFQFGIYQKSIENRLLRERLMATLSTSFAILALVLASVGLYGLISYMVVRRRNEIGIRMALGADRGAIVSLVLGELGKLLLLGVAIGSVAALFAAKAAGSLVFGLQTWDPASLALSIAGLSLVALIACYVPVRRAIRVQPMTALREE